MPVAFHNNGTPFKLSAPKSWNGKLFALTLDSPQRGYVEWNGSELSSTSTPIFLRGEGNTIVFNHSHWNFTSSNIDGNLEYLYDWKQTENGYHPQMDEHPSRSLEESTN